MPLLCFRASGAAALALLFTAVGGCGNGTGGEPHRHFPETVAAAAAPSRAEAFPVPPPPFSKSTIFPCMDCHKEKAPDLTVRELDEHDEIKLDHGPRDRWCFDCHNPDDRDYLRLVSGKLVPFAESYKLCGQCHGDKFRDWRAGVHGRRTGEWNGKKQYLLCAHCHNPHSPRFKPLEPKTRPLRPSEIRPTE